jgi:hypothetical protein
MDEEEQHDGSESEYGTVDSDYTDAEGADFGITCPCCRMRRCALRRATRITDAAAALLLQEVDAERDAEARKRNSKKSKKHAAKVRKKQRSRVSKGEAFTHLRNSIVAYGNNVVMFLPSAKT